MPVVAELRNVIIGDDTSWRAAVVRTQESLAALQAQSQQMTASLATAFAGASAPLGATAASFQALGNEAQAAATVITNSGQAAAVAAQNVASLGASAVQAGSGVAELALRKAQLVAELSNVNAAVRAETGALGAAQSAVQNLGTGHAALNNAVRESEANLAGYILRQAALKGELGAVNAALSGSTGAHRIMAPALLATGAATGTLGEKTGILNALFTAQTTQISSQRTIWAGYDNVIQAVIRTMGGIPVIAALGITILGIFAEKLLHSGGAAKDLKGATDDLIQSDLGLITAFNLLGDAVDNTNGSFSAQAERYQALLNLDLSALLTSYNVKYEELGKTIIKLTQAQDLLAQRQNFLNQVNAASADTTERQRMVAVELGIEYKELTDFVEDQSKKVAGLNDQRTKEEVAVNKLVDTLLVYRDANGLTTQSILDMERAAGQSEEAIARLAAGMDAGAIAARKFQIALSQAAKPPDFDLSATTGGLDKMFETAARGASLTSAQYRNLAEATAANTKNLKPLNDAVQQYAKYQAAAQGITGNKAAVDAIAAAKLKELAGAAGEAGAKVLAQSNLAQAATETTRKMGEAHRTAAGHVKTLSAALSDQQVFLKQLNDAMTQVANSITRKINDIDIGRIMHDKIAPVVETLKQLDQALRDTIVPIKETGLNLEQIGEQSLLTADHLTAVGASLRRSTEAYAAANKAMFDSAVASGALQHQFDILKDRLPEAWGKIVDAIVTGSHRSGDAAKELGISVAGALNEVAQVVGNLPGKIGDSLRKATSEFERWFNTIDGILKLLNRVFNQVPAGLGDALSKVVGIFHQTSAQVQQTAGNINSSVIQMNDSTQQWSEDLPAQMNKAATGVQAGANKIVGAFTQIAAAALAFIGARGQGFVGGALSGALGGIMAAGGIAQALGLALSPLTLGLSAAGGALLGGLLGLFGGGKSAIQKATEQAQLDKLKADIASTAQQTVNAALEGMKSALELFEKLADFTVIPQKTIHRFFNHLELVLQEFVELSKAFSGGMLDAAKAFAEKMGPIVDTIGNAVQAFEALGSFTGVAQISVDSFASAMTRVLQSFIGIKAKFTDAEGFIDSTVNQAKKFAGKIGDIIIVIKDALDAFSGFQTFKNVLPETLDAFAATLQLAINKMGAIAEAVDKVMIKTAQRFSDRAVSVVALIKTALDAFVPLATFAAIPAEAMDALFAGISDAVSRMQELAAALDTEMLTRAVAVAEKSAAIFNAIKGGVDALTSLADFKAVAPEAFQALLDGFNQAVSILNSMLEKASQFEAIAIQIESKLTSAAKHLKDGATAMAAALASAAAATSGTSGGGSAGVASLSAGPSVTGFGVGAPSSPFAPSGGGSMVVETYHVNVTVQGSMLGTKAELQDVVVGAITQAQRRGRAAA